MPAHIALILSIILTIVATILLYVKVLPKKLDGTFTNPFLQFVHNFFHFKKLYLEEVLKFLFTLATVACVVTGLLMMVSYQESYHYYSYSYGGYSTKESTFLPGLLLTVCGPVVLRLTYESIMMFILLVKNVMDINQKLSGAQKIEPAAEDPTEV